MAGYRDPVTGDELTRAEHISWRLQSSIRNFGFIGAVTVITVIYGIRGHIWTLDPADMWNYCMSWLALWIESIVGISMFSQTRRDAVKIRKIEALEEQLRAMVSNECIVDLQTYDLVRAVAEKLEIV